MWKVGAEAARYVSLFSSHPGGSLESSSAAQVRSVTALFAKRTGVAFEGVSPRIFSSLSVEACTALASLLSYIEAIGHLPSMPVEVHLIDKRTEGVRPVAVAPLLAPSSGP